MTKIGLVGLVNEEAKQDYWGTMQKVADVGYDGLESTSGLFDGDAAANAARLRDLGLEPIAVSTNREALKGDYDDVIARAHAIGVPNVVTYWGPCESRDQMLADAELYDAAGARFSAEGLKFSYHNHEHEFTSVYDGSCAFDLLVENTDPANVFFEVDIAWVTFGGEDPVRVLRRLAGRVPIIHVKDLWALDERGKFTAVGTGVVDIAGSMQVAAETGVGWAVVEQDQCRNLSAMDTVAVSYLNLKEQGFAG